MNVLADEDIPRLVVDCLRAEGHSVLTASEADLRGASDRAVFDAAQERGLALLTRDVEFGDLRQFPLGAHGGIILLRMVSSHTVWEAAERLVAALKALSGHEMRGCLVVVGPRKLRVRSPG